MTMVMRKAMPALIGIALAVVAFVAFGAATNVYAANSAPTSMSFEPVSALETSLDSDGYPSTYCFKAGDKIYLDYAESPSVLYTYDEVKRGFFDSDGKSINNYDKDIYLLRSFENSKSGYFVGNQYTLILSICNWKEDLEYCNCTVPVKIKEGPYINIEGIIYEVSKENNMARVYNHFSEAGIKTANIKSTVTLEGKSYPVTSIDYSAFEDCKSLTSVTIPDSVTEIGYNAFINTGLKEVTIPASVKTIGEHAIGYDAVYDYDLEEYTSFNKVDGFVIDAPAGSAGEKYAKDNGFKHVDKEGEKKAAEEAAKKAAEAAAEKAAAQLKAAINKAQNIKTKIKAKAIKKKSVKLTWKKKSGINGYVIYRANKKNGKYKKIKTIKKAKLTKTTVKKLKKGKKYFFKMRTFTKVSGKTYYGKWSNIAKVKVK